MADTIHRQSVQFVKGEAMRLALKSRGSPVKALSELAPGRIEVRSCAHSRRVSWTKRNGEKVPKADILIIVPLSDMWAILLSD